jgi:hypothetical protein
MSLSHPLNTVQDRAVSSAAAINADPKQILTTRISQVIPMCQPQNRSKCRANPQTLFKRLMSSPFASVFHQSEPNTLFENCGQTVPAFVFANN